MVFEKNVYYGCIVKGDLRGAMAYLKQFPEQKEQYQKFLAVFEHEQYRVYDTCEELKGILDCYQRYYRDVFYLETDAKEAEKTLCAGIASYLEIQSGERNLDDLEEKILPEVFAKHGFSFLGGRTGGYYGPYIWRKTESQTYQVELPDGIQTYSVNLLDDFLSKSWLDYISFGEIGTGGWSNGDGKINCVRSAYDLESEAFQVSLLKHEAQHARDLERNKKLSSEELEYRAKLVELIYSRERKMLPQFWQEADNTRKSDGHAMAAYRIAEDFSKKLQKTTDALGEVPVEMVQQIALELLRENG